MYFQHNSIIVTKDSFQYLFEYKKQLLSNITKLLNDNQIKYVISHGNLLEFTRKKIIQHDDDLDIRFDINDLPKWEHFCLNNNDKVTKYNLIFDHRFHNINSQQYNGIQCRLINFNNKNKINTYNMDIHVDLVLNKVGIAFWKDYDIDFNNLRKIKYLGVETYGPNNHDTHKVLVISYGKNYIIPERPDAF